MANYYYVGSNGQQQGPVPPSSLPSLGVNGETLVWTNGMSQWTKAKYVPEVAQFIQPIHVDHFPPGGSGNDFPPQPKPDNNMVWSILSTLFCCLPLGVYAIVLSSRVNTLYNAGDYAGAQKNADDAKKWAGIGAICGIVIYFFYIVAAIAGS